ncbi:copper amine oxidase N-terminal domain-containing protein [Bacillaceae bacterium SIJ1]|uniref:copper amine oxidase N-terminal domain-containing protein n=1 Tax=Litoribacterium kuwaitense TaxID=1398745 RepID=UPI0013ED3768|nr:copper amine oxidase N-terminal domain-containing protein [Litoribacterium kuwaitense]NGP46134.1 copper amine oxidase N-terminal domain-containing protein [Litoribacterium kuwaitense]
MRKVFSAILALGLGLTLSVPAAAAVDDEHNRAQPWTQTELKEKMKPVFLELEIDGNEAVLEYEVYNLNGRTMLPLRAMSELFGWRVSWDQEAYEVTIQNQEHEMKIEPGEYEAYYDGVQERIDTPAVIYEGHTFVSLRQAAEVFDFTISWEKENYRITLDTKLDEQPTAEEPPDHEFTRLHGLPVLPKLEAPVRRAVYTENAEFVDDRRMFVSDNPEVISHMTVKEDEGVLWEDTITDETQRTQDHRFFGYH